MFLVHIFFVGLQLLIFIFFYYIFNSSNFFDLHVLSFYQVLIIWQTEMPCRTTQRMPRQHNPHNKSHIDSLMDVTSYVSSYMTSTVGLIQKLAERTKNAKGKKLERLKI
jgi:hypothetical protein